MKPQQGEYHAGIDGLRAVAVLSVILFHLDARLLPGGFAGVDVFFVISGFVVSHSVAQLRVRGFTEFVSTFYARRLARIAPALVVCLLVTTLACGLFVPNGWLSEHHRTTAVAAFFGLSNFVLAGSADDYFAPRTEFNPFVHTWSLGVEEQFYLVFPLIFHAWVLGRRKVAMAALAVVSLASIAVAWWWSQAAPTRGFYLLPSRFWELGCGVALFMTLPSWRPRLEACAGWALEAIAVAGIALLGVALALAPTAAFPYPWAVLPVLASAVLIALAVGGRRSLAGQVLARAPVVSIGKLSYSLYLWHWPVFVLFRWTAGLDTVWMKLAALAVSFALAVLSYLFVERVVIRLPSVQRAPKFRVALGGLVLVAISAAISGTLFLTQGTYSLSVVTRSPDWHVGRAKYPDEASLPCTVISSTADVGGLPATIHSPQGCERRGRLYVAGDSHAGAYVLMLRLYAQASGREVVLFTRGGCPVLELRRSLAEQSQACQDHSRRLFSVLEREVAPGDAIFLPSLRLTRLADQWGGEHASASSAQVRGAVVREAADQAARWSRRGAKVIFAAPTPIFRVPHFRCSDWFNGGNPDCRYPPQATRIEMDALRAPVMSAMAGISRSTGALVWDPLPALCGDDCEAKTAEGRPIFFDGDHLSGYGNVLLLPEFRGFMCRTTDGCGDRRPLPGSGEPDAAGYAN